MLELTHFPNILVHTRLQLALYVLLLVYVLLLSLLVFILGFVRESLDETVEVGWFLSHVNNGVILVNQALQSFHGDRAFQVVVVGGVWMVDLGVVDCLATLSFVDGPVAFGELLSGDVNKNLSIFWLRLVLIQVAFLIEYETDP